MEEEAKKFSFTFSKLKKHSNLVKSVDINKPQVEYVDSFDGVKGEFSYKGNVRCDAPVKKELVIPLIGTKSVLEVIRTKLEEKNAKKEKETNMIDDVKEKSKENGNPEKPKDELSEIIEPAKQELSIEDLAAKEILSDLQNNVTAEKATSAMVIKQPSKVLDEKEIPIDYENIPVNDFGLAMLRGMGWTPHTGIGKEQRIVEVVAPKLRPKGLGLGADKVTLHRSVHDPDLTISIKSYVKFVGGPYKGSYGQVEAMDDDNSRVMVKLALGGTVSASEMLLVPVNKKDYEKNSKVINSTKYDTLKAEKREPEPKVERGKKHGGNHHRKEKYNRKDEVSDDSDESGNRRWHRPSKSSPKRRSHHKKRKKEKRDDSREKIYKKSKKRKKEWYSSDDRSDSSGDDDDDDDRHKREYSSTSHSQKFKSNSSNR